MRHTEQWYKRRLAKYFDERYWSYEDFAEFYTDPDINQYEFDIVENGKKLHVILTCDSEGTVSEQRFTK